MAKLSKKQLRDDILVFVDAGNPESSIYYQIQEHVKGKGWNDMEHLLGAKISESEVQTEINKMVKEGILRRREADAYCKAFCGEDTKWLTVV